MKRVLVVLISTISALTPVALAGNTSSNSSSNSSNGVHTRIDTIITGDDRGRPTYTVRQREKYGHRTMRRWHDDND